MKPKEIAATLNTLIKICNDGAENFRACAEHAKVDSPELNSLLLVRISEYENAAEALSEQIRTFGITPATGTTTTGALRRGWLTTKTAITGNDDLAVLEEGERTETAAALAYQEALTKDLPTAIRTTVELQFQNVLNNRDIIKKMLEAEKNLRN